MEDGYLYLMSDTETLAIKIGISKTDPRIERARQLNSGTKRPGTIECVKTIQTPHYQTAERILHRCYKKYNLNGEWFKLPQQEITALMLLTPSQIQKLVDSYSPVNSIVSLMEGDKLFYSGKKEYINHLQETNERLLAEKTREIQELKEKNQRLENELCALRLIEMKKTNPKMGTTRAVLSNLPRA